MVSPWIALAAGLILPSPLTHAANLDEPFCRKPSQSQCDLFKEPCSIFSAEVAKDISAWLKTKTDMFYDGKNLVLDGTDKGKVFPVNSFVCNPVKGELVTNRRGQNCGIPAGMTDSGPVYVPNSNGPAQGSLENSFVLGGYIAALDCVTAQVLKEVEKYGTIKVSAACEPLYAKITALREKGEPISTSLLDRARSQGLADGLCKTLGDRRPDEGVDQGTRNFCKDIAASTTNNTTLATLQQGACALAASATALKASFKVLIQCEIEARVSASYTPSFVVPGSRFEQAMTDLVTSRVGGMARRAIRSCLSRFNISPSCVENRTVRKVGEWYAGAIREFAKKFMTEAYPPGGQCWAP